MMADSSLDEFFAKKDRSKKAKNKAIRYTTSELAKKLEDPNPAGKKLEKPFRKDKEKSASGGGRVQSSSALGHNDDSADDEWKDFEEEKEKDYSGLRIQALSISDKEKEDEQYKDQQPQQNGDNSKSDIPAGPWKVVQTPQTPQTPPASPEPEKIEETTPKVGAYRPPQMRETSSASSSSNLKKNRKLAPEIGDESHFPSLSASLNTPLKGQNDSYSEKSFQSVKHGMKSKDDIGSSKQTLDLENKFSALHQGD